MVLKIWKDDQVRVIRYLLFFENLARTLVVPVFPFALMKLFQDSVLRSELFGEAVPKSVALLAYAMFAEGLLRTLALPIASELAQKYYGKKFFLVFSFSLISIACAVLLVINVSVYSVLEFFFLSGISRYSIWICLLAVSDSAYDAFDLTSPKEWFNIVGDPIGISLVLGYIISFGLISNMMDHYCFGLALGAALLALILCLFIFRESQHGLKQKSSDEPNTSIQKTMSNSHVIPQSIVEKSFLSESIVKNLLKRNPLLTLVIFLDSTVISVTSSFWIMFCNVRFEWNSPSEIGIIFVLNGICSYVIQGMYMNIITQRGAEYETYLVVISLAMKAVIYCLFSQVTSVNQPLLWILSISYGGPNAISTLGLRSMFFRRECDNEYSRSDIDNFLIIVELLGQMVAPLIFSKFFHWGYESQRFDVVFLLESVILFFATAMICIAISWPRPIVSQLGSNNSGSNNGAKATKSTRAVSPSLSTVVEEEDNVHRRRRDSIMSGFSEGSMDFNRGRPFGDTIVEWEVPMNREFYHSDEESSSTHDYVYHGHHRKRSSNLSLISPVLLAHEFDINKTPSSDKNKNAPSFAEVKVEELRSTVSPATTGRQFRRWASGETTSSSRSSSNSVNRRIDTPPSHTRKWTTSPDMNGATISPIKLKEDTIGMTPPRSAKESKLHRWSSNDELSNPTTNNNNNSSVSLPHRKFIQRYAKSYPLVESPDEQEEEEEEERESSSVDQKATHLHKPT